MALPIVAGRVKSGVKIGSGEAARCGDTGAPDAGRYDEYDTFEDRDSSGDGESAGDAVTVGASICDTTGSTADDNGDAALSLRTDRFLPGISGFSESLEAVDFDSAFPPLLAIGALWGVGREFGNGALVRQHPRGDDQRLRSYRIAAEPSPWKR